MRALVIAVAAMAVVVGVAAPAIAAEGERDVWAFGSAVDAGDTGELALTAPVVGMAPTPSGDGYWLAAADGGIFTYGNAAFHGSAAALPLTAPIVGIAATPSGDGYWLAAADGGIFTYGNATFLGSAAALPLTAPIVGIAANPDGHGYWLAAADGGIFTYGNATFHGSAAALPLTAPIVGIAATPSGDGYWLAAADGGIFTYGNAPFHGSAAALPLTAPIIGIAPTPDGAGYWLGAADGGIFTYGNAPFLGSAGGLDFVPPFVGVSGSPTARGYWLATDGGDHSLFPGIWPHTTEAEAAADAGADLDPVILAEQFMETYVGVPDATAGPVHVLGAGTRSVEVTPAGRAPTTTVTLRQLAGSGLGQAWTVTAANTAEILVDLPEALSAVGPLAVLLGRGRAFEGVINVEIRQDGQVASGDPLGAGFVMGGGTEILPFSGALPFTPPTDDAGAVVLLELSAEDGSPLRATVVRVALPNPPFFPGGLTLLPSGEVTPLSAFNDFVATT